MKRFEFKLEPVLQHRKRLHKQAEEAFFNAQNFWRMGVEELEDIQQEAKLKRQDFKRCQKEKPDATHLIWHLRYITYLNRMEQVKREDVSRREKEADLRKQDLIKVSKDKKIIEKLKEKKLRTFRKELMDFEQKSLDESAVNRFIRSNAHE